MLDQKITEMATQALELLSESGLKEKSVTNYKLNGLNPILTYFKDYNLVYYSKDILSKFVQQTYLRYECKEINYNRFQSVRKMASILDQIANNEAFERTPLKQWKTKLLYEIPKENLNNNNLIDVLIYNTRQAFLNLDISKKTHENYFYEGFSVILRHFREEELPHYSEDILNQFVCTIRTQYELQNIGRSKYQNVRKVASLIHEYYKSGTITWKVLSPYKTKELEGEFSALLEKYVLYQSQLGKMAISTIRTYKNILRLFLFHFQEKEYTSIKQISLADLSNYIPIIAVKQPGNMSVALSSLRSFSVFLFEHKLTDIDLTLACFATPARRRKYHEGFTTNEIEQILASIDRTVSIGIRDYAILILAIHTGLRAIDISELQLSNIDWRNNEIRIVQSKTKTPLVLPLEATVGNAIIHYILNSRPESDSPYIFLRQMRPYQKLNNRGLSAIASKYIDKAGIENSSELRKGFHSFRRTLGTNMLESGISMYTISEVLGHTDPDSSKPYLSTNHKKLRDCCLPLAGIELKRTELI